jgi:hypothetical protein
VSGRLRLLPPVQRGDMLALRDDEYLFGAGDLVFRVLAVHEIRQLRGEPWIFMRALELRADDNGRRLRDVLVRGLAMQTRRRRPL